MLENIKFSKDEIARNDQFNILYHETKSIDK